MICSGFLVCGPEREDGYSGVETNAWPLGECAAFSQKTKEFQNCGVTDQPCLTSSQEAMEYYSECIARQIPCRILYCQVDTGNFQATPFQYPIGENNLRFLGMDYAYPSGSYFSVFANEVKMARTDFHKKWKERLNPFGLLPSQQLLTQFIRERDQEEIAGDSLFFEKGCFVTFGVYEVVGERY